MFRKSNLIGFVLVVCILHLQSAEVVAQGITPDQERALERIEAAILEGHLSFLASDLLQGRSTPSPGETIAAEYIAAQFRSIGLEPGGNDDFFQSVHWMYGHWNYDSWRLQVTFRDETIDVPFGNCLPDGADPIQLEASPLVKIAGPYPDASAVEGLQLTGAVVLTESGPVRPGNYAQLRMSLRNASEEEREAIEREIEEADRIAGERSDREIEFRNALERAGAKMRISLVRTGRNQSYVRNWQRQFLWDPAQTPVVDVRTSLRRSSDSPPPGLRTVSASDVYIAALFDRLPEGRSGAMIEVEMGPPVGRPAVLKNVIGVLPGSDPDLRDTCVLVTAHYDHVPVVGPQYRNAGEDSIRNGANDNASGTASVIEIARALTSLPTSPARTVVFMAMFGEETGMLGTTLYSHNPIFPIDKTIAMLNMEQMGRTDDSDGPQINRASLTGFDFSDMGNVFLEAGELTGIEVFKHPRNSDSYFGRSDNALLARLGVPAHTLCVAYSFEDYHGVGDEWEKIDYDNMARVVRMAALGVLMMAESETPVLWNQDNPRAARYYEAWKALHGGYK